MSGVDRLNNKIIEDARERASANLKNAEAKAGDIVKKAEQESGDRKEKKMQKARAEASRLKERLISIAELESRKRKLKAKQDLLTKVFDLAVEKLVSLPDEEYMDVLVDMAVPLIRNGNEKIILSSRDRERLEGIDDAINKRLKGKGIKADVSVSKETGDFSGGFILKRGKIEVNNTFETIMRMERSGLEREVVKVLFG